MIFIMFDPFVSMLQVQARACLEDVTAVVFVELDNLDEGLQCIIAVCKYLPAHTRGGMHI